MEIKSWSIPGNLSGFWRSTRSVRDFGMSSARHLPLTKKKWSPLGGLVFYSKMPVHYVVNFKIVRALPETRWIATSVTCVTSSQWQRSCCNRTAYSYSFRPCHREGLSPWRSTVSQWANRIIRTRPLHTVDCRVGHLRSLLARTLTLKKWSYK